MTATKLFFKSPEKGTTLVIDGVGVNDQTSAGAPPIEAKPGQSATFHVHMTVGDEFLPHHIYRIVAPDWKDDVVRSSWNVQLRFIVFESKQDLVDNIDLIAENKSGFAIFALIRGKTYIVGFGYQMFPKQSGAASGTYFDVFLELKVKDKGGAPFKGIETVLPLKVRI